jgi:hypothetical protein
MKKYLLPCILLLFQSATAQTYDNLVASGKKMVKEERAKFGSDFAAAIVVLKEAIKMNPKGQEAHYYLGSAYDYSHNPSFTTVRYSQKDKTIQASREFEEVIKINATYKGDIIALDPYAKLSSVWGCLAYSYMARNLNDSAKWAFAEGKKRGGFPEFALQFNRMVLRSFEPNAIYFTYGDFSTMLIWYLQTMEGLRPDVALVHINTIDIPWVSEDVYRRRHNIYSSAAVASDTTPYFEWTEHTVDVPIGATGKTFSWTIAPTNYEKYITRANSQLIDIVTNAAFATPIYFETGTAPEDMLGLHLYTEDRFLASKLLPEKLTEYKKYYWDQLNTFPYELLQKADPNCGAELFIILNLRYNFIKGILALSDQNKKEEARLLYQKMEAKLPDSKYPADESQREYLEALKKRIEK